MSALTVLSIAHNSFSRPIPKELGNLKELTMLSFGSNNFSGTLPPELGNLVNLGLFYMDSCGLGGEIPSTFAKLIKMKILYASDNPFSGKIPSFIGNWRKLISLDLCFNNLTGELLPSSLFNMSSLTYFNIYTPATPGKKNRTGLIGCIAVPVGVVILLLLFAVSYVRRKTSEKDDDEDLLGLGLRPNTFSYAELRAATEDFNPSNKLGEGGYGPVYKGTLSDGRVVAVKQISVASHQGKSQFVTEIATISAVQHRNLVKLYGCCIEGSHRILVYEYLENKSLDQALFGRIFCSLKYTLKLHPKNTKISDFGWAKLYDDNKTHMSTRVAGTIRLCYLVPEYAMRGRLTEKADVFGFGVIALEILSGRPNSDNNLDPEKIYLLEWSLGLVDPRLTEFDENDATSLIKAALLCTQASPMMRPSMSRVVAILSGDIEASTVMSKPSYLADWDFKDVTTTSSFLVDDDTSSTESNVLLNHQPEGSTTGASPRIDPAPSQVNVTGSMLTGFIGEGM
ncbi:hypothetical protein PRUPE_5G082900 [Prunus persica]|uniref:Uncharacterized protein n=1 Tax=Prunus persica TaxID=3760 RepID=M5WY80_PRUPE|nr:hypothetical protein PRUPE_5G082900 [Prunus persica]